MNAPLHVHLMNEIEPHWFEYLGSLVAPNVRLTYGPSLPDPASFQILVHGRPESQHLEASPQLHTLIIPWAGVPTAVRKLASQRGLAVHNLHHNATNVAEMVMALLLSAAHFVAFADRRLRENDWRLRYAIPNPSITLNGKTAVILGYGAIGQRVAAACRALGMRVMATKATPAPHVPDEVFPPDALEALLPQATVLIVCLPLTQDTKGLIKARQLALLPPKAVLVNVGRGRIIDEKALYDALADKRLHAAGLDVWYNYPTDEASQANTPPSVYPFGDLDNVVLSPHRGGAFNVEDTERLRMEALAELINKAAQGEPLPNGVDLLKGY